MLKRSGMLLLALMAAALVGCAHSPQQLTVQPQINKPLSQVAQQQPVSVRVQDTRQNKVLGTRGGIYPNSSNITISDSALPAIRQQVEQALRQLGFNVVPEGTPNANSLTLNLADLRYQSPKESVYVTQADISATFVAEASNMNRNYQGRFSSSLQQRFGYAPNQETNTKLVTDVMSDALTRVFQDPMILQTLQQ